jgi:hypothetical protein
MTRAIIGTSLTFLMLVALAGAAEPAGPGVAFTGHGAAAVVKAGKAFDADKFTVALWVKPENTEGSQVLAGRRAANEQFTLYFYNQRVRMLVEHVEGKYTHANVPLPQAGVWTHYAGTYDGEQIKLFVNGKLAATTPAKGRVPQSAAPLFLGGIDSGDRSLVGRLEDVRFYNQALADDAIPALLADPKEANLALVGRWTSQSLAGKQWQSLAQAELPAELVTVKPKAKEPKELSKEPPNDAYTSVKDDGYRGIWYSNQKQNDEYVFKYSGGLGTYCSSHNPFAIYRPEVGKTFFCYGGTLTNKIELLHMVSYYDHKTGLVPRPTIIMNKRTDDAHDNPVISIDKAGYIWIFSSSHGTSRPSYIWKSVKPYEVDKFQCVLVTNFSYTQPWYLPEHGFLFLQTLYRGGRKLHFQSSPDGVTWSEPFLYGAIEMGHYQVSGCNGKKVACAFNFHPTPEGLNKRSNLYYMETSDFGRTWQNIQGETLKLPLTNTNNPALVHDYRSGKRNVYVQDLNFDAAGRPVVLYTTSGGYESGPVNDPRVWTTAAWNGREWEIRGTIRSDNNYDMGSLYLERDNLWRIIGPTENGPQAYNTGGEIAMWTSPDRGATWKKIKQMTSGSENNHGYCRRPVNAQPDFYALWADGHGRQPSASHLYFCDQEGNVRMLPTQMKEDFAKPVLVTPKTP